MGDLFDGYGAATVARKGAPAWDEMFAETDVARESYREIYSTLAKTMNTPASAAFVIQSFRPVTIQ